MDSVIDITPFRSILVERGDKWGVPTSGDDLGGTVKIRGPTNIAK